MTQEPTPPPAPVTAADREARKGTGHVFFNPDTGEEYARNHPVKSGEVPDATGIRRSTPQEDALHAAYQAAWARANALEDAALHRIRARGEVLEEAARVAERWNLADGYAPAYLTGNNRAVESIASAIRALANSKPVEGE